MLRTLSVVLGILLIFGCADVSKENQFQTGCSEGSESTPENVYVPPAPAPAPTVTYWTQQIGTNQNEIGNDLIVTGTGNIYLSGSTSGDFDNYTNADVGRGGAGYEDILVLKYNTSGSKIWSKQLGVANLDNFFSYIFLPGQENTPYGREQGKSITADSNENIYITGIISNNLNGENNNGNIDAYIIKYDSNGALKWTRMLGTSANDGGYGIYVDGSNNIFITGRTDGDISGSNAGGRDGFLAKYDINGNQIWIKQFGTDSDDEGSGVISDTSGNIYVTGITSGSLPSYTNAGLEDIFIIKYDTNGNIVWTQQLGTSTRDYCYDITIDSNNNLYITGYTWGDLDSNINGGSKDVFITKYSSAGVKQWTKLLDSEYSGTADWDEAYGIAVDSSDNVYITGFTDGNLGDKTSSNGFRDFFIAKYDSNGNKKWVRQVAAGGANITRGRSIAIDSSNNIFVTGDTNGSLDQKTSYGMYDTFILKYDTDGNRQ